MKNTHPLLHELNDPQAQAVAAPVGNLLILAGAGSGKTRVLVHRIAWLVQEEQASPFSILAVTFTNKAANEMRLRVEALMGTSTQGMWIGTFHSLAHRLLRTHWRDAKLPENFQIIDSQDQLRLIKRIMRSLNIDETRWPPKQAQWFINQKKDEGLRSHHLAQSNKPQEALLLRVYQAYEEACEQGGMVDFAEILLRSHELWLNHPELLLHYQQRFSHILVDEFQDTNAIQYAWLRMLAGKENNMMVVGDDDQSIYSWRGACVDNIHQFKKDLANVTSITLAQNYRSTSTILNAANALISFNEDRLGKDLWTQGENGDPIRVFCAYNEIDEARFIADELVRYFDEGNNLSDSAILYRSNVQSRVLEDALIQKGVAYKIFGGFRYFERSEIKDALAYMRLISSHSDDTSFERIVNMPPRGIGNKTVETIRDHARENQVSLWQASQALIEHKLLTPRALTSLSTFIELIDYLGKETSSMALEKITELVIEDSGLIDHFKKEKGESGRARVENLTELVNAASEFDFDKMDVEDKENLTPLTAFLAHAALEAGDKQADNAQDCVKLMTLHSAKGLEFPFVILCGMEEGLFPHQMSMSEPGRLEEERRLCYVGMTRAMKRLLLTYAETRRIYGKENQCFPSRFVRELPQQYLQEIRMHSKVSRPVSVTPKTKPKSYNNSLKQDTGYNVGQLVSHKKFGEGVILDIEPNGEKTRVQIKFRSGVKWLIASIARLETLA